MKIYSISAGLYQSAKPHDLSHEEKRKLVYDNDINVVVNLWHSEDPEMRSLVRQYWHYPMADGKTLPDMVNLEILVDTIYQEWDNGSNILVHCYGGRNRAGLFNAMLAMKMLNLTGREAVALIKEKRPNSLVNTHFVRLLEKGW